MHSSKTAALISVANNYEILGKKVLVLKPRLDTRDTNVTSRTGASHRVDYYLDRETIIPDTWLVDIVCVLVDEAQFLSSEVVEQLRDITIKQNIPVICYGLRTDYQLKLFEGSKRLLELADSIEEYKTICASCVLRKAIVNHRKVKIEGQIIVGDSIYESICYSCFKEKTI
jgi:thymidine kinase